MTRTSNSIKMHDMVHFYTSRRAEIISARTDGENTCSIMARFDWPMGKHQNLYYRVARSSIHTSKDGSGA